MTKVVSISATADVVSTFLKQKSEFHFTERTDNEFILFLLDTAVRVVSIVQHLAPVIEAVSEGDIPCSPKRHDVMFPAPDNTFNRSSIKTLNVSVFDDNFNEDSSNPHLPTFHPDQLLNLDKTTQPVQSNQSHAPSCASQSDPGALSKENVEPAVSRDVSDVYNIIDTLSNKSLEPTTQKHIPNQSSIAEVITIKEEEGAIKSESPVCQVAEQATLEQLNSLSDTDMSLILSSIEASNSDNLSTVLASVMDVNKSSSINFTPSMLSTVRGANIPSAMRGNIKRRKIGTDIPLTDPPREACYVNSKECPGQARAFHEADLGRWEHRVCPLCGKEFTRKPDCQRHYKSVHLKIHPFVCQCGKTFAYKFGLTSHIARHHPELLQHKDRQSKSEGQTSVQLQVDGQVDGQTEGLQTGTQNFQKQSNK